MILCAYDYAVLCVIALKEIDLIAKLWLKSFLLCAMKYIGFQVAGLPGNNQLGYKCSISIKKC